ncbi:hypothetical protein BS329_15705 [Amycolatopsis coloradensis]|uniref:Uncharacterized protein n=1 Tax=Amycolatopsis coloradensis TaxID=76021 RepID=A0A1R0KUB2_9PSEU|nr:hypothetical protein [Amycolatopsis coloradensis]OLZ51708.1 hypothetical protein BS329_15705 [Amycolatopsis coloradensis]
MGTSTVSRILLATATIPVHDLGLYRGGPVDLLITSNTAAATARLGHALAACPRAPVLIVMHTVPGGISRASKSHLRSAEPHLAARFEVFHHRQWPELENPPGKTVPKPVLDLVRQLPEAIQRMYAGRAPTSAGGSGPQHALAASAPPGRAVAPARPREFPPRAGPPAPAGGHHVRPPHLSAPQSGGLRRVTGG